MNYKKYIFISLIIFSPGCTPNKHISLDHTIRSEQKNNVSTADLDDDVKIQSIATMALDMGIMLGAQAGASMANSELGMQAQLLATIINKNSQTAQTSLQAFQSQAQQQQQTELQAMIAAFSNAQQNVQAQTSQATNILDLELNYLYQNISTAQPQQNYIFNQIQYDQLFTLGTMLTPQGSLWKNPFSVGDWEYEKSSNSFWQYQSSPIFNQIPATTESTSSTATSTQPSSLQAENNSIFAEYFTNQATYTIAGSINLYVVSYPFFAGIIFNKARWISGDFEAIRKCRMVGIYGISPTNIGIYFAQQYTMTDAQVTATESTSPIQTPLQQILANQIQPSLTIPAAFLTPLPATPATLQFSITNSPTSVTLNFTAGSYSSAPIIINKLDPQIYMYHGIGCICPGAIAQFTLTQPTDFIFSQQAISNYQD